MSDSEERDRPELNISPISYADGIDFDARTPPNSGLMNMSGNMVFASSSLESVNSGEEFNPPSAQFVTPLVANSPDNMDTPKGAISVQWMPKESPTDVKEQELMDCQTAGTASTLILPSNTALKIKVNKLKITAKWKWIDGGDDRCGICRAPFESCCIDCRMPGDDCPLVVGACKHPFHIHCIVKWTNTQQKAACPLCRQEWKFQNAE